MSKEKSGSKKNKVGKKKNGAEKNFKKPGTEGTKVFTIGGSAPEKPAAEKILTIDSLGSKK
jgi:hypothetical protein